jgi:hypothetical protein
VGRTGGKKETSARTGTDGYSNVRRDEIQTPFLHAFYLKCALWHSFRARRVSPGSWPPN